MQSLFDQKIECVAFDLEGTIIDLEALHHKAHAYAAKQVGLQLDLNNLPAIIKRIDHFIGGPDETVAEEIYQYSNKCLSAKEILTLDRVYYQRLLEEREEIRPRDGFLKAYDVLSNMGIPMAVGTLTAKDIADHIMQKSGLDELFPQSLRVFGEEIPRVKPAPDIWLETARRMDKDASRQLVFEDAPKGILAAIIAHSIPIGMPVYHNPEINDYLSEAGSIKIYKSWKDIDEFQNHELKVANNDQYIQGLIQLLQKIDFKKINALKNKVKEIRKMKKTMFVCGNGGSAATASHIACDFGKTALKFETNLRLHIVCLNDNVPFITAWANDKSYQSIFSEQLKSQGRKGDFLLVLTGSGNSKNIINVVDAAKEIGIETFGLLGFNGGKVKELLDDYIIIPSANYGYIEDAHAIINHLVTDYLKR